MNEVWSQKKSKKEGEKEPRSQITPRKRKNKIRVTLVRLLWCAAAPGLKPLRLPRAQRSCKQATQPLPTKEAAKLAWREGGRRVYSFWVPLLRWRGPCGCSLHLETNLVEEGEIHSVCHEWMSSTWGMLSLSKTFMCLRWVALWSTTWQVGHLVQTWHGICPPVDLNGDRNEMVDVTTFAHEDWVDESVNHTSPSATIILIDSESEAPVFLKANLTGKHCVYTDSWVYRVIVLGCYRSHWVYICVHVYIIEVLGWTILQRRILED